MHKAAHWGERTRTTRLKTAQFVDCSRKFELHLGTNYGVFLNGVVEISHVCPQAHSHVESSPSSVIDLLLHESAVCLLQATDREKDPIMYSILSGDPDNVFELNQT